MMVRGIRPSLRPDSSSVRWRFLAVHRRKFGADPLRYWRKPPFAPMRRWKTFGDLWDQRLLRTCRPFLRNCHNKPQPERPALPEAQL